MADGLSPQAMAALYATGDYGQGADPSDLQAFQRIVAQNNPYRMAAIPVYGARIDTTNLSPGATLGTTAGQAFLGAALMGMAQNREASQLGQVVENLPNLYADPLASPTPEGVDPEAYQALKGMTYARTTGAQAKRMEKLLADLLSTDIGAIGKKKEVLAEQAAKDELAGGTGLLNPGNLKLADIEKEARDALKSTPAVNNFQDLKTNFKTMESVFKYPDKASNLTFVSSFARVLDPASVVREGEIRNVENTQSFLGSLGLNLKSLVTGEQTISPEVKAKMLRAAGDKYNRFGSEFQQYRDKYADLIANKGGNPDNVFAQVSFEPFDFDTWAQSAVQVPDTLGGAFAPKGAATIDPQAAPQIKAELETIRDMLKAGVSDAKKDELMERVKGLTQGYVPTMGQGNTPLG